MAGPLLLGLVCLVLVCCTGKVMDCVDLNDQTSYTASKQVEHYGSAFQIVFIKTSAERVRRDESQARFRSTTCSLLQSTTAFYLSQAASIAYHLPNSAAGLPTR